MPSNRKKRKRTKSKITASARTKKTSRARNASTSSRPKRAAKTRPANKKSAKARSGSNRRVRGGRPQRSAQDSKQVFSGRQSGDLQGLSRAEQADSESVDELVEEGNLFEAGAVAGVEEADSADEREVHTHEVPEDDVPEEYLDRD